MIDSVQDINIIQSWKHKVMILIVYTFHFVLNLPWTGGGYNQFKLILRVFVSLSTYYFLTVVKTSQVNEIQLSMSLLSIMQSLLFIWYQSLI